MESIQVRFTLSPIVHATVRVTVHGYKTSIARFEFFAKRPAATLNHETPESSSPSPLIIPSHAGEHGSASCGCRWDAPWRAVCISPTTHRIVYLPSSDLFDSMSSIPPHGHGTFRARFRGRLFRRQRSTSIARGDPNGMRLISLNIPPVQRGLVTGRCTDVYVWSVFRVFSVPFKGLEVVRHRARVWASERWTADIRSEIEGYLRGRVTGYDKDLLLDAKGWFWFASCLGEGDRNC